MVPRGLHHDNLVLSRLIKACSSLGLYDYMHMLFINKDVYFYNIVIKTLSQCSSLAAITIFNKIQVDELRPDVYTFPFVLKAVIKLSNVELGRQVHSQTIGTGLNSQAHVVSALVQMYSSCGCIMDARRLFDEVSYRKDSVLWNAMVVSFAKVGEMDAARQLFEQLPESERSLISWTAMISGYVQVDRANEAILIFRNMHLLNVTFDEVVMLAALSACAQLGALQMGELIHNYVHKLGMSYNKTLIPLNNALIDMYAKSGNIYKALEVFERMELKTVISWTTILTGLALNGLGREALDMFSRMERVGVRPNEVTFIAVLSACSHVGLVETGRLFFNCMESRFGIRPNIEHYGCMIDLLGRAGYLLEAKEMVKGMPFEANARIWGSLLAAANTHSTAELGEYALHRLIEVEPYNSGNYALLSNLYASRGKWVKSGEMRTLMRDTGVKKLHGGSFIEVSNQVHKFISGDTSHPRFERIHQVLQNMNDQLKMCEHLDNEGIS
ncbi:hypothetical protein ACFE04_011884 [Oxalis oulophora]